MPQGEPDLVHVALTRQEAHEIYQLIQAFTRVSPVMLPSFKPLLTQLQQEKKDG